MKTERPISFHKEHNEEPGTESQITSYNNRCKEETECSGNKIKIVDLAESHFPHKEQGVAKHCALFVLCE